MRKILIVDDTKINRTILRGMLSAEYAVAEAASGEEALAVLDREHGAISAALLDIVMPGMDGYEVLRRIRTDKRFPQMPVIMITASEDETTRVKSLALKANDFVMKPYSAEILRHCLQNNIALSEATAAPASRARKPSGVARARTGWSFRAAVLLSCAAALLLALCVRHFDLQGDLRRTCAQVAGDFGEIMDGYRHSFRMFELLLQQELAHTGDPDEIERFLKAQDRRLLAVEGGDYDGVYMYYRGRYLYSWDTPYEAYAGTGYDATTRPWYVGAVAADGEIFFSTPYPSYANDYMLATISRLQEDGETVIAYDIKLGEIDKYVRKLYLYDGSLALICDGDGNIIGSTDRLYLGGNYTSAPAQLDEAVAAARRAAEAAGPKDASAAERLLCAEAQRRFAAGGGKKLAALLARPGTLRYFPADLSLGYAASAGDYTCFVMTPIVSVLSPFAILWAALSFVLIALSYLVGRMLHRNHQILSDALTGLNNRRAFIKYYENHIQHHAGELLGLLMLDLDHFKQINDLYGHATGDQALLDTAAVLKSACAGSPVGWFLCRYGGDEFLLAARAADDGALERMRALIAEEFKRKNATTVTPYVLEASMGAASGRCADKKGMERLLAQADQAMYEEKRAPERPDAAEQSPEQPC